MASDAEEGTAAFVCHDTDTSWLLRSRQEISLAIAYLQDLDDEQLTQLAAQLAAERTALTTAIDQAKECWDGGARVSASVEASHGRHAASAARAAGRIEALALTTLKRLDAAGLRRDALARGTTADVVRYMSQRPLAVREHTANGARLRTLIAASAAPPTVRITLAGAPPSAAELEQDDRERTALLHSMSLDYSRRPPREQLVCLGRQASAFIAFLPSIVTAKEKFPDWVASCRQVRDRAHALAVRLGDDTLRLGCEELGPAIATVDLSAVHGAMVCLHRALADARHRLAGGWDLGGLPEDEAPKQSATPQFPVEARALELDVDSWDPEIEPAYFSVLLEALRFLEMEDLLAAPPPNARTAPRTLAAARASRLIVVAGEKNRPQSTRRVAAVAAALLAFLDRLSASAIESPLHSLLRDSDDFNDISADLLVCVARGGVMPNPRDLIAQARQTYDPEEATRHEIASAVRRLRNVVALEARTSEGWSRATKLLETCDLADFLRSGSRGEVVGAVVGWAGLTQLAREAGRFDVGRFLTTEDAGPFPGGVTGDVRDLLIERLREASSTLEDERLRDLAERVADGDLTGVDLVAAMRQALRATPHRESATPRIAATYHSPVQEQPASMSTATPPRVMISYSWDTPEHRAKVIGLAKSLSEWGVRVRIDAWDHVKEDGLPAWMMHEIEDADFVLCVCTATYRKRVDLREEPGKGLGATFEGKLIHNALLQSGGRNKKFIPVVFSDAEKENRPTVLQDAVFYCLDSDEGFKKLFRRLTSQPEHVAPTPGPLVVLPPAEVKALFSPPPAAGLGPTPPGPQ